MKRSEEIQNGITVLEKQKAEGEAKARLVEVAERDNMNRRGIVATEALLGSAEAAKTLKSLTDEAGRLDLEAENIGYGLQGLETKIETARESFSAAFRVEKQAELDRLTGEYEAVLKKADGALQQFASLCDAAECLEDKMRGAALELGIEWDRSGILRVRREHLAEMLRDRFDVPWGNRIYQNFELLATARAQLRRLRNEPAVASEEAAPPQAVASGCKL